MSVKSTDAVVEGLASVYRSEPYRAWLADGMAEARPFPLVEEAGRDVLTRAGLARDGTLRVKINELCGRIFVTDGIWVDRRVRVFPFPDESSALLGHVRRRGFDLWAETVADLATGSGHNAIAIDGDGRRFAFDVSPRALAFANLNRALNRLPGRRFLAALNDVRDGVPDAVATGRGNILLLANMPFGPAPSPGLLPATSDGGERGVDLQIATMEAIRSFADGAAAGRPVRASLLGLTLGDASGETWEMVEAARRIFGRERVGWTLLSGEKLLRVSGRREQDNPAPAWIALPRIAECRLYVADSERDAAVAGYRALASRMAAAGSPDIAYGVVDITIN